jgi:aminomethyltransferase
MAQAELHHSPAFAGGKTGQYLGVETTLSFAALADELEVLHSGAAVFELDWRALINVSGKDRVRWLHNMVTNNIRDLQPNHGRYNFVLNAQGRILGDLYVFNRGESLLIQTDRRQVETLLTTLRRFIIMDKVELSDLDSSIAGIGVAGPKAQELLSAAGIDTVALEPLGIQDVSFHGVQVQIVRGGEQKSTWFEIWLDPSQARAVASRLTHAGASSIGAEALEMWRVLLGIPQYGVDIRDRDLPQETGQMQALNFNKGCYIGQEIVERIRSRGQVHRKFTGFVFAGGLAPVQRFEADGRTYAEVTSAAKIPAPGGTRDLGIGYVRQDAVPESGVFDLNGIKATVASLPFEF